MTELIAKLLILSVFWGVIAPTSWAAPHHVESEVPALAPGYRPLGFELPEVGSYERPIIGYASDGVVIDSQGKQTTLHALMRNKVTLLSFMYASCSDVNGCPLASYVLNRVMQQVTTDPRLSKQVQLLSLSFDRLNDTPEVLATYAARFEAQNSDNWRFLTAKSDVGLDQMLNRYNQFVITDVDANGKPVGTLSHLLRVYLVDQRQNIREVYSVSFLHPDILIQDILTVFASAES